CWAPSPIPNASCATRFRARSPRMESRSLVERTSTPPISNLLPASTRRRRRVVERRRRRPARRRRPRRKNNTQKKRKRLDRKAMTRKKRGTRQGSGSHHKASGKDAASSLPPHGGVDHPAQGPEDGAAAGDSNGLPGDPSVAANHGEPAAP